MSTSKKKKSPPKKATRRKASSKLPPLAKGASKRPRGRPSKQLLKRSAAARRGWETRRINETIEALSRARSPKRQRELGDKLAEMLDVQLSRYVPLYTRALYDREFEKSGEAAEGQDTDQSFDFFFKTVLPSLNEGGILADRTMKILKPMLGGEVQVTVTGKVQSFIGTKFHEWPFDLSRIVPVESYRDVTQAISAMIRDYAKEVSSTRGGHNDSPFVYLVENVTVLPSY